MQTLRLSQNLHGRDFVVGDIHGHFDLLEQLFEDVGFDPQHDRLFSVGDCIDRGPYSEKALDYLKQPWFYAVRGNHEDLLLAAMDHERGAYDLWMRVGGGWAEYVDEQDLQAFAEVFEQLPLAIEVETANGLVGIVHADVPDKISWPDLLNRLEKGRLRQKQLKHLMWSRDRYKKVKVAAEYPGALDGPEIPGVHRVYVGHNIVEYPVLHGNIMFIDTGAFCGGQLTLVDLFSEDFYFC